jgi:CRISPR/Cas system CMR-associated protein Cmr1 (group 7 of RAMP superfamily)
LRHHLVSCHYDKFVSLRYGRQYSKIVPKYHQNTTEKAILTYLKKYMKGKREVPSFWDFKVHELDFWGIDLVDHEQPTDTLKLILKEP